MLGAYVAPDGNTKEQVEILTKMAKKWAHNITKSYLSPHEALTAYVQVLFPALVYPVAVMPLTEAECDKIVQPAIKALLSRINMPLTTARTLLYGPSRYGGLELPNLYVHGNTLKIMILMGHLQKCDATEPILRISLGNIQQQVGISRYVLEENFSKYSFLVEHSWFKHVWKFLHEFGGSLSIPDAWTPQSPYENDNFLMDMVMSINTPDSTITKFNLCRLQKQMYFFTDTLDSKNINLHSLIAHPNYHQINKEKFPMIEVP